VTVGAVDVWDEARANSKGEGLITLATCGGGR
jgi:hypothetical protein